MITEYSVREAATELNYATSTIVNMIRMGDMKATKHGRCWMIPASEIKRIRGDKNV